MRRENSPINKNEKRRRVLKRLTSQLKESGSTMDVKAAARINREINTLVSRILQDDFVVSIRTKKDRRTRTL
jgi:hypothetical protein